MGQSRRVSDNSTIFHRWQWLKAVERHTGCRLQPLVVKKGTEPVAIFPLFLTKRYGLKLALSPPPMAILVYLGPAMISYDTLKRGKKESLLIETVESVDEYLETEDVDYLRIRTPPFLDDPRPFSWRGYQVNPQFTYVLDLKKGYEGIWANLSKSLRRSIEKTRKKGLEVREGDYSDVEYIRTSMKKRFQDMGVKVPDDYYKGYMRDLYNEFYPENFKIFIVDANGERTGGFISLCHRNRISYWFGLGKTSMSGVYPNDLLQWETISWAIKNGFRYYEQIDAGDDPRLRHYKSKFNPDLIPWYSAVKSMSVLGKLGDMVSSSFLKSLMKKGRW